jgi:hypothetical protein
MTDITDPNTGEPLYIRQRVRSRWWYRYQRVKLFLGIVWRRYHDGRISFGTAREIAFNRRFTNEKD